MNREERDTRNSLVILAIAAAALLLPIQAALIVAAVILVVATAGSIVYGWVTFDRHVDDALEVVRAGEVR